MLKFMDFLRSSIRTDSLNTLAIIFSSFYGSLMVYFLTPLAAAAGITEKEIENIEKHMKSASKV